MLLTKKILRAAADLRLRVRPPLLSPSGGNYRTRIRGTGMQFKEFRHYAPGDDIRHMAWTVTARTGRPTIKLYEEERNLEVCIALDTSPSSRLAAGGMQKSLVYSELAAAFALAALRQGDSFCVAFFSNGVQRFIPPSRSRTQLSVLASRIEAEFEHGTQTDLNATFEFLRKTLRPQTLVLILSDFNAPLAPNILSSLCRKHEVVAIHATDPIERGQGVGIYETADPESGRLCLVDLGSRTERDIRHEQFDRYQTLISKHFFSSHADYLHLKTDEDYLGTTVRYFFNRSALAR